MTHYHELSTEKYLNESVEAEIEELKLQKNRESNIGLLKFVFAAAVFSMTVFAVQQMPNWLPAVTDLMKSIGSF